MNQDCRNLDAYLANDLPTADAARFTDHLQRCDFCRDAVDEQQWIDGLLQSSAAHVSETPPAAVLTSLHTSIAVKQRRAQLFACGLAAAAAVVIAVGWIALSRQANDQAIKGTNDAGVAIDDKAPTAECPRAMFVASSNAIVVPVESHHPDVTVVRVYPTYQPRFDAATAAIEPEATNKNTWRTFYNGG